MKKNNIILIGFMGCGKSTVGVKLSYRLQRTLIDTDKWIEKRQQRTITDIFAKEGEQTFRQMETDCLKELLETADGQIIAVGGGLPVWPQNHQLLGQLGTIIYLQVTPQEVYERLSTDTTRPLLQGEDPQGKIKELLAKRMPVYEELADRVIVEKGKDLDTVVTEITAFMQSD